MPDDRRPLPPNDEPLNRFWNELVRPGADPSGEMPTPGVDPEVAETVRRLRALAKAPPPAAARARLRGGLADQLGPPRDRNGRETTTLATTIPAMPGTIPSPNGRAAPLPPLAGGHRTRALAPVATALLMLLMFVLVYAAFGLGRRGGDPPAVAPTTVAPTAVPVPAVLGEATLLAVTLPRETLPGGDGIGNGLGRHTVAVGARATKKPYCCPGLVVDYVLSGAYAVRAEGAMRVIRAGGTEEDIAAGAEVVLGPGDAVLSRNETALDLANAGDTPLEVLSFALIDDPDLAFGGYALEGWTEDARGVQPEGVTLPTGPTRLRLRRLEVPPNTDVPVPPGSAQSVVLAAEIPAGTPAPRDVGTSADGTFHNFGRGAVIVYAVTLDAAEGAAATPAASRPTP